jgi:hypothetical protein
MKRLLTATAALACLTVGACTESAPARPPAGENAIEISIRTEPAAASIVVDGMVVGPSPQLVKLNPGPHRVRATASGYYPTQDTRIQVGVTEPRELVLTLVASH